MELCETHTVLVVDAGLPTFRGHQSGNLRCVTITHGLGLLLTRHSFPVLVFVLLFVSLTREYISSE